MAKSNQTQPEEVRVTKDEKNANSGPIAWFVKNPVAANLMMLLIFIGGISGIVIVDTEVFPRFRPHQFIIDARYPGAGPLEIEESVCIPIEQNIFDAAGIKHLYTEVYEDQCLITVFVLPNHDKQQLINTVRGRVQAIQRLPKGLEQIEVNDAQRNQDDGVIWVTLHGDTDPLSLKRYGDMIQKELAAIPGVTKAHNYEKQSYEIVIEIASVKLKQFHLSFQDIAATLRRASLDLPGGLIKSPDGELLLSVKGKAGDATDLGKLAVKTNKDGTRLLLSDIANIKDHLEERLFEWHHNGETAQGWEIHSEHDTVNTARRVKAYIEDFQAQLPPGLTLKTWWDDSQSYEERVRTLLEDGISGFLLVCLVLTLFLRLRVAVWAGTGIITSLFGALWLMPVFDVSLNMLSLFGFLLAMGILVDDAIIIGESIYTKQSRETDGSREAAVEATIAGAKEVALPVMLSVMIALIAFLPGLFLPGWTGQMMKPICMVMIFTLVFSLVEALFILPSHLVDVPSKVNKISFLDGVRTQLNAGLDYFVANFYRHWLNKAMAWRYLTVSCFLAIMMISAALVQSDRIRKSLQPDVTKDSFWVNLTVPKSAPYSEVRNLAGKVEQALMEYRNELDGTEINSKSDKKSSVIVGLESLVWEHEAGFWLEFSAEGRQRIIVEDFIREWRRRIGNISQAKIDFLYKEGDVPYDIEIVLSASDPHALSLAADKLKKRIADYPGVYDVIDSAEAGKPEIRLKSKAEAERLGLRLEDIAEQVRNGYYGKEIYRLQRGQEEVKVMVRYPLSERQSLDNLRTQPILLPEGNYAPLSSIAQIDFNPGYAKLTRQDRLRVLKVEARVDPKLADLNVIYSEIQKSDLPRLRQDYPGLKVEIGQERQEQELSVEKLSQYGLIALIIIYALIAVPFQSYVKPLIFLLAAPVAWSGAVLAHWITGLPLSMESMVGMIAASGVVVNDSLVLLDYIKENESSNLPIETLISEACRARFRPILLAFLTNFAGFLPTLLETSPQAQFLIPMTLSLSAGLFIGMAASLILTPVCYAITAKH